jgi:hypothetical protein
VTDPMPPSPPDPTMPPEPDATKRYAAYDIEGLRRCCLEAVPVDENRMVLAGTEGERRPCPYGHERDPEKSGVRFVNGKWRAAWIVAEETK